MIRKKKVCAGGPKNKKGAGGGIVAMLKNSTPFHAPVNDSIREKCGYGGKIGGGSGIGITKNAMACGGLYVTVLARS